MLELSIIIPIFNDEEVIFKLIGRLIPVVKSFSSQYEILFIDDGSWDETFNLLKKYRAKNDKIKIIKLSKNYGQSNAITAGLDNAKGKILVIMDSDLQDKPEDIPILLAALEENNVPMVIAKWEKRKTQFWKRCVANLFFRISNLITDIHHPPNLGVFRAFYKILYDENIKNTDYSGTTLSQFYKLKFDYQIVNLQRDSRFAGNSGYNLKKMIKLALDRIIPHLRLKFKTNARKPFYKIEKIIG
ncbi:MAG: glycosyltransferase family 2 protein [Candidatus Cloacimonadota bacterium]|nr:glycosyltransferase family 2 protein [Candidatus Cloacimonadota bacterium]